MDGKIDTVREALYKMAEDMAIGWSKWDSDEAYKTGFETGIDKTLAALSVIDPEDNALKVGRYFCAQMPCSPTDCTEVPCRYMKDAIANRNNRDPEAIRRECANRAERKCYEYLALGVSNGSAFVNIAELKKAILGTEPAQEDKLGEKWQAAELQAEYLRGYADGKRDGFSLVPSCDAPAQDDGKADVVMTMIENGDLTISWECSGCKKLIDDKEDIESRKKCPHCGATPYIMETASAGPYLSSNIAVCANCKRPR